MIPSSTNNQENKMIDKILAVTAFTVCTVAASIGLFFIYTL